jgi:hypothetical protein
MCMSLRTQATTNPLGHLLIMFFCYLLTGAVAELVIACVLDDIHIYDMFFVIY